MKMAKEKTSRLGTGLSALFGEEENVLENETVQTLPISRVCLLYTSDAADE